MTDLNLFFEEKVNPKGKAEVRAVIAQGSHGTRTVLHWWDLMAHSVVDTLDVDIPDEYLADVELPGKGIWVVDFHMKFVTYHATPDHAEEYDEFVRVNEVRPATKAEIFLALEAEEEEEALPAWAVSTDALSVFADGFPDSVIASGPDERIIYWATLNYTVPEREIREALPTYRKMTQEDRAALLCMSLEQYQEAQEQIDFTEWEDIQLQFRQDYEGGEP